MLINGNGNTSNKDNITEVPVCNKTELLVRDGRNYAGFTSEFSREIDTSGGGQKSVTESEGQGGVNLLLQLL